MLQADCIGIKAAEVLVGDLPFRVRGVTSRGTFLDVDGQIIVFLSRERFRGPLIVNLTGCAALEQVQIGAEGRVCNSGLRFQQPSLWIETAQAKQWSSLQAWSPAALPENSVGRESILAFLNRLRVRSETPNELIEGVVNLLTQPPPPPGDENSAAAAVAGMLRALRRQDLAALEASAHALAGRGRGLTPSGDDFLLGIGYGMFMTASQPSAFSKSALPLIAASVKKRSTLISGNLLECAVHGEVDERLGAAFDALLHPQSPSDTAIEGILSWGSSSGLDASAGMVLFLAAKTGIFD